MALYGQTLIALVSETLCCHISFITHAAMHRRNIHTFEYKKKIFNLSLLRTDKKKPRTENKVTFKNRAKL